MCEAAVDVREEVWKEATAVVTEHTEGTVSGAPM